MKVFGLLSDERAFVSKSPAMHNRVLKAHGIDGVYVPFAVRPERIGEALAGLRALGVVGANVTVPHKKAVMAHLDALTDEARAIGAVNTIVRDDERLIGRNTDAAGFIEALQAVGFEAAGAPVLVIGTGGAARAVLYALRELDVGEVTLVGRNESRRAELARNFGGRPAGLDRLAGRTIEAELIVNATSVSSPAEAPELAALIGGLKAPECRLVFDLNYGRADNFWRESAEANGVAFTDGLTMLAGQARRSFALWTGLEVDLTEFAAALKEAS